MTVEELAALMRTSSLDAATQVVQTSLRSRVIDTFGIAAGSRVLEIACGQGDTTAVLADRVGAAGHVVAIDPAPAGYGAPITVGDSLAHLQAGPLGSRLSVHLGTDLIAFCAAGSAPEPFDHAVLSLGSFYFASRDELLATLRAARTVARSLCLAEWDLTPRTLDQVPHLLAVLAQGQSELLSTSTNNVRTPFSRAQLLALVAEAGWTVRTTARLDAATMHDGGWEIGAARSMAVTDARPGFAELVGLQLDVIGELTDGAPVRSLDVFTLTAD